MPESKRLKAYWLSSDLMLELFREGRVYGNEPHYDQLEIVNGIPEGAVIHAAEYNMLQRAFVIVVEHESFPEVLESVDLIPDRIIRLNDVMTGSISTRIYKEPVDG